MMTDSMDEEKQCYHNTRSNSKMYGIFISKAINSLVEGEKHLFRMDEIIRQTQPEQNALKNHRRDRILKNESGSITDNTSTDQSGHRSSISLFAKQYEIGELEVKFNSFF